MPKNHKDNKKVFDTVFEHSLEEIYDGWTDWRTDLLLALVPLCHDTENRKLLENFLSTPENNSLSEWSRDFDYRQKQMLQHQLIKQYDSEALAQGFIEQNLDNIDFRCIAIKHNIANKDYEKAITLCIEGEAGNIQYPGIIKNLQELRYTAYEAAGNIPKQKELALTLLLGGDFAYFLKYKELHSKKEWDPVFNDVLNKAEKRNSRGVYVEILVHEKHKPRLLAYCKINPSAIASYYTHLLPEYIQEVGELFSAFIKYKAESADNRGHYQDVCELIKICDKACPGATSLVCSEIIEKYARRPAFMDEMQKIGKL